MKSDDSKEFDLGEPVVPDSLVAQYLQEVLMEPLHLFEGPFIRPRVVVPNGCEHQVATGINGMYAAHAFGEWSPEAEKTRNEASRSATSIPYRRFTRKDACTDRNVVRIFCLALSSSSATRCVSM